MEFNELIKNRESIRSYDSKRIVEPEKLKMILEAGRLAPSAANRQPWRFYLVSSDENLAKVRECYHRQWFKDAPHLLIVAGKRSLAWSREADGYDTLQTDLTIAMDHMILAAESLGVGTCWIVAFDPQKLRATGILEDEEEAFFMTPLGYPEKDFNKTGRKIRKPFDEVVKFI
ncbi:MAG: nitroreductase family protein [Bacteroidales bacterium]|nr:nitroreductase family protein [Bacteroidales bacterium]